MLTHVPLDRFGKGSACTQAEPGSASIKSNEQRKHTSGRIKEEADNLFFESGKEAGNVIGSVTSLTVVPLPAAAVLFGAGLAALIGLGGGRLRNPRMPQT